MAQRGDRSAVKEFFSRNWQAKLGSLALALVVWALVRAEIERSSPIEIRSPQAVYTQSEGKKILPTATLQASKELDKIGEETGSLMQNFTSLVEKKVDDIRHQGQRKVIMNIDDLAKISAGATLANKAENTEAKIKAENVSSSETSSETSSEKELENKADLSKKVIPENSEIKSDSKSSKSQKSEDKN